MTLVNTPCDILFLPSNIFNYVNFSLRQTCVNLNKPTSNLIGSVSGNFINRIDKSTLIESLFEMKERMFSTKCVSKFILRNKIFAESSMQIYTVILV